MLTEKYQINESIKNEIEFLNLKKKEAENLIGSAIEIKNFKEDLESLLLIYEEELKKFQPSLEVEELGDAIYQDDLTDMTDLLREVIEQTKQDDPQ